MKTINSIFFLIIQFTFSQAPDIEWQNRIGGSINNASYASQQTSDGGFIIGGRSNSNISGDKTENSRGQMDYWIVKTNSLGVIEWDKTIGGGSPSSNEQDFFFGIKETIDNGYIICGYSDSPLSGDKTEESIGGADYWIVKISNTGTILWQNTIGGTADDVPYSLDLTSDGGYIIGGYSESNISGDKSENSRGLQDYWVVKLNSSGFVEWNKTIGGSGNDVLQSIIQTSDGNYFLGGRSNSNISGEKEENSRGNSDYWIIKLNTNGNIIWQKTIGGNGFEYLSKVIQTQDSGYLLAGYSNSNISGEKDENSRGSDDFWVVKTDSSGNIMWQKTIGGSNQDGLASATTCDNVNYLLVGSSDSGISGEKTDPSIGSQDAWLVKINSTGTILWQKTLGGLFDEGANSVVQTIDGGYFVSGVTDSPTSGNIVEAPIGIYDYWILKLEPDNLSNPENMLLSNIQIYPNPTNGIVNINFGSVQEEVTISIINILGQVVSTAHYNQIAEKQIQIEGQSGVYFLEIVSKDFSKKVVKIIKN